MKRWFAFVSLTPILFLCSISAASAAPDSTSVADTNLWDLLLQGGWAMIPLGCSSLALLFLIFHSYRETARRKFVPDAALPDLSRFLVARDLPAVIHLVRNSPSVLSRGLEPALARARPDAADANKEQVEAILAETLEHEENSVGQWINYLNVVATIAPMIGLLGTVSGMIGAFQTISRGGMGRPELLAGDIGEALITTATGLVIGIPAMIAYFVLRNRLDNRMLEVSQTATKLVDHLAGEIVPADVASVPGAEPYPVPDDSAIEAPAPR